MQIAAQRVELERLVVDDGGAAFQVHDVFARRFRIHGHQEIDFLVAADIAVLAGANGEPGGQALNVGREHILPGHRNAHLENGAHQNAVGGLTAGPVYGGDLNAEIVDDGVTRFIDPRQGGRNLNG